MKKILTIVGAIYLMLSIVYFGFLVKSVWNPLSAGVLLGYLLALCVGAFWGIVLIVLSHIPLFRK